MSTHDCDVVIVGGGLVGLTVAAVLNRAGTSTILLEADEVVGGSFVWQEHHGTWHGSSLELTSRQQLLTALKRRRQPPCEPLGDDVRSISGESTELSPIPSADGPAIQLGSWVAWSEFGHPPLPDGTWGDYAGPRPGVEPTARDLFARRFVDPLYSLCTRDLTGGHGLEQTKESLANLFADGVTTPGIVDWMHSELRFGEARMNSAVERVETTPGGPVVVTGEDRLSPRIVVLAAGCVSNGEISRREMMPVVHEITDWWSATGSIPVGQLHVGSAQDGELLGALSLEVPRPGQRSTPVTATTVLAADPVVAPPERVASELERAGWVAAPTHVHRSVHRRSWSPDLVPVTTMRSGVIQAQRRTAGAASAIECGLAAAQEALRGLGARFVPRRRSLRL